MPYIITGESDSQKTDYSEKDYKYTYPDNLNLKPDSDFHKALRNKIWSRARESRNEISKRFSGWREIDKKMTVYIPLKDKEKALEKKDTSKPDGHLCGLSPPDLVPGLERGDDVAKRMSFLVSNNGC